MPKPKTPKLTGQQEIFAREYVRLGVAVRAYRLAYPVKGSVGKRARDHVADPNATRAPDTEYVEASKLMANPRIAQRIKDIQEKHAEVAMGEIVTSLRAARDIGLEDRNAASAVSATVAMARVKGYLKNDVDSGGDIHIHIDAALKGVL